MSEYTCPHCHGGFPAEVENYRCPWCGTAINGSYDPERYERVLTRVREDGGGPDKAETPLEKLKRVFT